LTNNFFQGIKGGMDELTALEAADELGVSVRRLQELVKTGRLPARRFGRAYVIRREDLKLVADRKPGRPKKQPKE
jgi:excisionase family DNA binding protein